MTPAISLRSLGLIVAGLLISLGLGASSLAGPQPQTTIKQLDPEPFREWTDRSETTMPKTIEVRAGNYCSNGGACVNWKSRVMSFPKAYLNDPGFYDARATFYHEAGHIFQLENNDEVQAGYPALDARCEGGVFTQTCAELFAVRYANCARSGSVRHEPTCAFIEEVGG